MVRFVNEELHYSWNTEKIRHYVNYTEELREALIEASNEFKTNKDWNALQPEFRYMLQSIIESLKQMLNDIKIAELLIHQDFEFNQIAVPMRRIWEQASKQRDIIEMATNYHLYNVTIIRELVTIKFLFLLHQGLEYYMVMQEFTAPATGLTPPPRKEYIFGKLVNRSARMVPVKIKATNFNKRVREFHEEVDQVLENIQSDQLGFSLIDKLTLKNILIDSKLAMGFGHIIDQEVPKIRFREFMMANGTSGSKFLNLLSDHPKLGKYFGHSLT